MPCSPFIHDKCQFLFIKHQGETKATELTQGILVISPLEGKLILKNQLHKHLLTLC